MTIGRYPAWSVAAAREEAKALRRRVDGGDDPLEARLQDRAEATLADLWASYDQDIVSRKAISTQRNVRSMWRRLILPVLGQKKLSRITSGDIDRLHRAISVKTPFQANRCMASIRHAFTTARRWGMASTNPVSGVELSPEERRERYLTDAEVNRFLAALDRRGDNPVTLAMRFLLFTGARSGEVFKASWEQFDLSSGVWTKPSAHTKQRRLHRVPLSDVAIDVLVRAQDHRVGEVVFPNRFGKPLTTIKKTFASVCKEAELANFRVHDLRHSYASVLAGEGLSLPIIGRLLGHTQVATTSRYSHLADEPLRVATNLAGRRVLKHGTAKAD